MKNESEQAVVEKLGSVEGEQGTPKDVGSEPPDSFGHGSVKSEGVSGAIPKES